MDPTSDFHGAKLALFHGDRLVVYRRDDKPGIPFPDCWDFPGGGREGEETPAECALRELEEEFSLRLPASRIDWSRRYPSLHDPRTWAWFLVARLTGAEFAAIRLGGEGQCWRTMAVDEYLEERRAVPYLQARLRDYLASVADPRPEGAFNAAWPTRSGS